MTEQKQQRERKPHSLISPLFIRKFNIVTGVMWNLFLFLFVLSLFAFAFAAGTGAGYFAALVKDEPLRSYDEMKLDIYNYEETTEVYFASNQYLGMLRSDLERQEVKLSSVSPYLINAIIATEDPYFYRHKGVVPKAIFRAIIQDALNSNVQSGGSTLTQQLIKNQILTNEVSFERKAKEILLALRLEKYFSKEDILEAYLNMSPFGRNSNGRNIAGAQAAAQGIFGVNAKDLSLPQAAFIAGLPQSPYRYTPFTGEGTVKKNLQYGLDRMKVVLSRMKRDGYISEQQYEDAVAYNIAKYFTKRKPSSIEKYPYLTFEVEKRAKKIIMEQLANKAGYEMDDLKNNQTLYDEFEMDAARALQQNGYKVYTTIDKNIYDSMQNVARNFKYYGSDRDVLKPDPITGKLIKTKEPVEVGAMLIENRTGKIISFVGGRDYKREQINHATQTLRQNGSTMKPLLVYAPAIEEGVIQPGSLLADVDFTVDLPSGSYSPKNYDGSTHGLVSARKSLQFSYNIPAIKTYMNIIDNRPITYLEKMGFSHLAQGDAYNLSLALGGLTKGVTVEENVNAYATFGNGGKFVDAYLIDRITTKDGDPIYQHEATETTVFSPETTYMTVDMMRDVITEGTARSLPGQLKFRSDWAGKTGTGQDYKDSWFVATNPNVSFGVWIGYDTPKPLERSYRGYTYGMRNIKIWADLMNAAYYHRPDLVAPKEKFKQPPTVVSTSFCGITNGPVDDLCAQAGLERNDLFNKKYLPNNGNNALLSGRYVLANGKTYAAQDNTPSEFVYSGVLMSDRLLDRLHVTSSQLNSLLPNGMGRLASSATLEENGQTPAQVDNVSLNGNVLFWTLSRESDIIGYRIYEITKQTEPRYIASVTADNMSYTVSNSSSKYAVTAVDIAGNESTISEEYFPNINTEGKNDKTTAPNVPNKPTSP